MRHLYRANRTTARRRATGLAGAAILAASALALAPIAHAERTVLTSNSGSGGGIESITPFSVNADGTLTPHAAVPVGDRPEGVTVTPDARFAYVATSQTAGVRGYAIGPGNTLTEIVGSPFSPGAGEINTTAIAVTPSGDRLLVANRGTTTGADPGSISVFDINQSTGGLTAVTGSPFAATGIENHQGIAIAPSGARVFVVGDATGETFDGRVAVLDINAATGALTSVADSPFDVGGRQPFAIEIAPDGARVFIGDVWALASQISVANVSQATGALTEIVGSPFASAGRAPIDLSLTPDGGRLFAAERALAGAGGGASSYTIAANGALTPVAGSPFAAGGQGEGVATTPDGARLFGLLNANPGVLSGSSISAAGALSPLSGSPYPTGDKFAGFFPLAMTPSNTPQPSFATTPAPAGQATTFDASATIVPGGRATRFDWDFGDGASLQNGGPTPTHIYLAVGIFSAELTVRNDCDPSAVFTGGVVFTGQTALCNGATEATVIANVDIPATPIPMLSAWTMLLMILMVLSAGWYYWPAQARRF